MAAGPRTLRPSDIEARIADPLSSNERVDARSVQFLLRLYAMTGRADLIDRAGLALAAALQDHQVASSVFERSAWLEMFVEAHALAEDARVSDAAGDLIARLRGDWTSASVAEAAAALDACLRVAMLDEHRWIAPAAVDQLERVVRELYRPGRGVGACAEQILMACALLSAYELSGRLPYSMLAEELVAAARPLMAEADFITSCQAARALIRLAVLHADADYQRAAVVAPASDYRRDAERILAQQSNEAERLGAAAAIYGVALLELESLTPSRQ